MTRAPLPAPPAGTGRSGRITAVVAAGGIVVSLQQTVVIPLLPQLPELLDAAPEDVAWVVTATVLAAAVAVPVVGRLADMLGKRRVLLALVLLMLVGSVVAALSTSLVPLLVGRALQGVAAGVVPLGISLLRDALPAHRVGGATALVSASLGVGGALGLPVSAVVVDALGWQALFWGSAGLAAAVLVLVRTLVPESARRSGGSFDVLGALLLATALVTFLLAVSKGAEWGWGSTSVVSLLVTALVSSLLWGWWQLRATHPLVDLRVSRRRPVLLTNAASAALGFSMFAMSLVYPQLLQLPVSTGHGLGQSLLVAGLVLAPSGLAMVVMAPVSARVSERSGPRTSLLAGALVVATGYALGAVLHGSLAQVLLSAVVISAGIGLAYGAMPTLVMSAAPPEQAAAANSLNNLCRSIGISVASALSGVLLTQLTEPGPGAADVPSESAFVLVLGLGAGAALVSAALAVGLPRRRLPAG